jgi:hypothetical protein
MGTVLMQAAWVVWAVQFLLSILDKNKNKVFDAGAAGAVIVKY